MPNETLFSINLHGNTGSRTPSSRVTFHSQPNNIKNMTPDMASGAATRALFHGWRNPAFSSAATNKTEAPSKRNAPSQSIRAQMDFAMLLVFEWCESW